MKLESILRLKRVTVFAPHQDDEIFGSWGLIYKLTKQLDKQIKIVFISNGEKGVPGAEPDPELALIRKREAASALQTLGITDLDFLDFPDGELSEHRLQIQKEIEDRILVYESELVLFPHHLDDHPDHKVVSDIILTVQSKYRDAFYLGYEIWSKIESPTLYVPLTEEEFTSKLETVGFYASQLKLFDYRSHIKQTMKDRGNEIDYPYAEAYISYK
ncbi:PIG-L deacetylase family protein [Paenibacillus woosongensis]|uniref:GlcNAc-PI de-N-acetylase n=1 Tax=Paenibacillus woosongensis TaxID=307580 RepID=A0A7X2Z0K0_9BACL|nr:PIG-L family deacetylase [Paenibacillus woosongensis]MUG45277.1 hypothetical protein [Paenibacillus woosongensis]